MRAGIFIAKGRKIAVIGLEGRGDFKGICVTSKH
jgi:hypothetical protein